MTGTTPPPTVIRANIFAETAPIYREHGYWPRPIAPGTKASHVREWQKPDPEIPPATLQGWITTYAGHGIGLLMGSPFPDGTRLGAIDVDRNEYVRLARTLLRNPPCGRFGSKGAVFFVRVIGDLGNPKFRLKAKAGEAGVQPVECLFNRTLCVIPPTIHPATGEPYRWIGTPLLEVDFNDLPLVGE